MYVPLQVGVFFLLLFFLKVAFACIDGMCSNSFYKFFSFFFRGWGRVLIRFSVAALRVPSCDVLQRNYENSASLLEKLRNKIFRLGLSEHLPFKCYVCEGFASKVTKITKKHLKLERVIH